MLSKILTLSRRCYSSIRSTRSSIRCYLAWCKFLRLCMQAFRTVNSISFILGIFIIVIWATFIFILIPIFISTGNCVWIRIIFYQKRLLYLIISIEAIQWLINALISKRFLSKQLLLSNWCCFFITSRHHRAIKVCRILNLWASHHLLTTYDLWSWYSGTDDIRLILRINFIIRGSDHIWAPVIGLYDAVVDLSWWFSAALHAHLVQPTWVRDWATLADQFGMSLYTVVVGVPGVWAPAAVAPRIYLVDHRVKKHCVLHHGLLLGM